MNIVIKDILTKRQYVNWARGEFQNLTYTLELPGGMVRASFDVPIDYKLPYKWAKHLNEVEIWDGAWPSWSGVIWGLDRYWNETSSGIHVDCLGHLAWLGLLTSTEDFATGEKMSTHINDHILGDSKLDGLLVEGLIHTDDYVINDDRDYSERPTFRKIMDDLYQFNANAYDWYVLNKKLYFVPVEQQVTYITSTIFSTGNVRQEMTESGNMVYCEYTNTSGDKAETSDADAYSPYPLVEKVIRPSGGMSAAVAGQITSEELENSRKLGTTAGIKVWKAFNRRGIEVPVTRLLPGKVIRIEGLVPGQASITEAYSDNDIDNFPIKSITYEHESRSVTLTPGRVGYTLPVILSRMSAG